MKRYGYRERRLRSSSPGTLDRGLALLIGLAGAWALIASAILIIGAQQ